MVRPCFLVFDREYSGSISTRKLVIETAKFNVITVYSAAEAVETLKRFPAVQGVIMDSGVTGSTCEELVTNLKSINPSIPVIAVRGLTDPPCANADYQLDSFVPTVLLGLLQKLMAAEADAINKHDEELHRKE